MDSYKKRKRQAEGYRNDGAWERRRGKEKELSWRDRERERREKEREWERSKLQREVRRKKYKA